MNKNSSIAIIGGGIVGCAIAYELSTSGFTNITVIERRGNIPGLNQSSTNEGTIHSGVYYLKDIMPLKATLCVKGNTLMYEFCEKHGIPYKKVGKLIIATNKKEETYLDFFLKVGTQNGVLGIKKISAKAAMQMEPNLSNIISALYVPSAGSTSPIALIKKIKKLAERNGVLFLLATTVMAINPGKDGFNIITLTRGKTQTRSKDILINTAGLYADEVAKMVNPHVPYTIEPIRGEFFVYDKSIRKDVWMNGMHVYQPPYCYMTKNGQMKILAVSAKKLPLVLKKGKVVITAGIHLSPAYEEVNGKYVLRNMVTISPLKTSGIGKENYRSNLHKAKDYIEKICYFFPHVKARDLVPSHAGIMAVLKDHRDFIIERDKKFPNCINLVGMESPAWTSSLAIAKYVKNLINPD